MTRPSLTKEAIMAGASAGHEAALSGIRAPIKLADMPIENQDQAMKVAEATILAAMDVLYTEKDA